MRSNVKRSTLGLYDIFNQFRSNIINIDPVAFCESNLTLDGKPFRLNGNGYKPFADIYRYIGLKSIEPDAKPVVLVKGRQVGATTMAAALECYFMACGLFGTHGRSPLRLAHLFPTLSMAAAYTKTKLDPMISSSKPVPGVMRSDGTLKSFVETAQDTSSPANDNLHFKQFIGGNQVFVESTGLDGDRIRGRQLSLDTEIPTPSGFIRLKNLKQGDELFDENGNVCKVTKLHPINQTPEAYKVTFDDGTTIEACAEHLWYTQTKNDRRVGRTGSVKNTKDILNTLKINGENNHSVPVAAPLQYPKQELLVDPYLLGLWLGDGSRNGWGETADPEILVEYEHHVVESTINHSGSFSTNPSKSSAYRVVGLTTALTKLGLIKNPGQTKREKGDVGFYNKHIPKQYLIGSVAQRLALLQGLMDSDGCCGKDGRCEFVQVESRKELAYQVLDLINSLGIKASISKRPSYRYNVRYQDKYRIQFYTTLPVFRLSRKLKNIKDIITKSRNRFIKSIDPIISKPMRCITVDSPSHLYLVTRSCIPTHNTIDAGFFDEIQDIPQIAIGAVTKVLAQAQYGYIGRGIQVYFGTPKQKGTAYWNMWQMSQQNYYHLHCEGCDKYFPLYHPDVNWEEVWLYGYIVKCIHCGHEQDKRKAADRGRWIAVGGPDNEEYKYIGYHINQLYIPRFTKETIIEQKPEHSPINTERIFQNEVLGEFFDGEGGTISPDEIHEKCADLHRKFAVSISPSENKRVYAGFDWGQRGDLAQLTGRQRGQSYSCTVILTAESPHLFNIEFGTRLKRNDMQTKEDIVEEMFRRYSVHLAVGDIGDAFDLTHVLQRKYDERFLASRAAPNVNGHIKLNRDIFPKEIVFERDYYISELMGLLKNGNIRFPYGSYEQVRWLVNHCCSMEIKVSTSKQGDPQRHYVKGPTPNDGFMALLNAYIAYKCDITSGFTIKHPKFMHYNAAREKQRIPAVTGYCPRIR